MSARRVRFARPPDAGPTAWSSAASSGAARCRAAWQHRKRPRVRKRIL